MRHNKTKLWCKHEKKLSAQFFENVKKPSNPTKVRLELFPNFCIIKLSFGILGLRTGPSPSEHFCAADRRERGPHGPSTEKRINLASK